MNHVNEDPRELGYKVLYNSVGILCSIYSPKVIEYNLNKWIHRPDLCGPLCVYSNLIDAITISNDSRYFKIYKCSYTPSETKIIYSDKGNYSWPFSTLPKGTILADSVMLLSEVE